MTGSDNSTAAVRASIGSRYQIEELLGRGGMACVHRALDVAAGRRVALKQLVTEAGAPSADSAAALFEREFQTLVQLRHPHVISVYDYGLLDDGSPYYTMELLDGGDLRELAPLPWRDACRLLFEVCSSLALLHSRRLLHRDVSPRNIRCTQAGTAKLIDFGAMAPMSAGGAQVVGTPAFTAPETLHRLALDARTDLYSLGVTLYYVLTGRLPYPARSFADLLVAWGGTVAAPSALVAEIPAALDDLVLALISLEPALRPQSAFDVMQRLAACAGLQASESEAVSRAYLSTPTLIGRDSLLLDLRKRLLSARLSRGSGVLLSGTAGIGRSRLLDACVLEAKTQGFTVLRAAASGGREAFGVAGALMAQLLDTLPHDAVLSAAPELFATPPANDNTAEHAAPARRTLRNFADPELDPAQLQQSLCRVLLKVSRQRPLLIAVDDVHRIDPLSAALLAELIEKARRGAMLVALTADDAEQTAPETLAVLSRRCGRLTIPALSREQTGQLLASLFGDVANLEMLSAEIHRVGAGNPRQSMELAQYLVDRELIRYASGTWTLPSRLSAEDLPSSAAAAMRARIALLSSQARLLAEAQALAFHDAFEDRDYRALLPDSSSGEVERALSELIAASVLVRDGALYLLSNRLWSAALTSELPKELLERRHRALVAMYEAKGSFIPVVHHLFAAGSNEQGLDAILNLHRSHVANPNHRTQIEQNIGKMMWCYGPALETAQRLGRSRREVFELRRAQYGGSVSVEDSGYTESARAWFEQLAHDSGLDLYRQDTQSANPSDRLMRALQAAQQRYLATPEHDRVYTVEEAIRRLGEYVVLSIAIGGRTQNSRLVRSLADILQPFVALSPLLDAIWNNALACRYSHCECRYELAREHWHKALAKLETMTNSDARFVEPMRNAIAYALGMMEAQLGLSSASGWADRLDDDPYQRISALNLRQIVRLEQGDALAADRLRREAEVLSLQRPAPQMFKTLLPLVIAAHVKGRNLAGVQQVIEQLRPLAARYPSWLANLVAAEGGFHLVRGDYDAARAKFEHAIELTRFDEEGYSSNLGTWVAAQAGLAEAWFELGRTEQAHAVASAALAICEARQIGTHAFDLVRWVALSEAKLGVGRAAERLDALIEIQTGLGATGLRMGLSYEARARIAIWTGDVTAFTRYAELTAREYRHGARTTLGARYERLMNEAGRQGFHADVSLSDFESLSSIGSGALASDALLTVVTRTMSRNRSAEERCHTALQLICAARGASAGHLYLITPDGPELAASHEAEAPPHALAELVTSYVEDEHRRSATMDDMITGDVEQAPRTASMEHMAGGGYELLPLGCVVGGVSMWVAVAAIAPTEQQMPSDKQAQLLNVLAGSLLHGGDSAA